MSELCPVACGGTESESLDHLLAARPGARWTCYLVSTVAALVFRQTRGSMQGRAGDPHCPPEGFTSIYSEVAQVIWVFQSGSQEQGYVDIQVRANSDNAF